MALKIEFLPWYVTGASIVRCEGDDGCGAMVLEADAPRHVRWHEKVSPERTYVDAPGLPQGRVQGVPPTPLVAVDPNSPHSTYRGECSMCPGRGRPCNGPHDCSKV